MKDQATLLRLTDELYSGIADADGFRPFTRSLRLTLGAAYTGFVTRTNDGSELLSDFPDPTFLSAYRAHFHAVDPFCDVVLRMTPGQCSSSEAMIAPSKLSRTEFYNDFMRPRQLEGALAGVIERGGGRANVVSAFFARSRGPTQDSCEMIARLLPHIQRASRVRANLVRTQERHLLGEQLLEQFTCAALLVRRDGRLLLANRTGSTLLAARDGLYVDGFELRACAREDRCALEREILLAGTSGRLGAGVIRLRRPSGKTSMVALVSPLAQGHASDQRAVLVLVRDPDALPTPSANVIAQALGLTLAEARVAQLVASGLAVKEAAAQLRVSEHTARNQLKSAMRKSGTTRQLELVRQVLLLQR